MNKKLKAEIISAAIFQKKPTAAPPFNPSSSAPISSSSLFYSSKGSRGNLKRKNFAKIFPHYLEPFLKYFIWKKESKKIMAKRFLKAQILANQVPVLVEEKSAHSLSSAYSSSSKLFVKANPDLLEVSCTQI